MWRKPLILTIEEWAQSQGFWRSKHTLSTKFCMNKRVGREVHGSVKIEILLLNEQQDRNGEKII